MTANYYFAKEANEFRIVHECLLTELRHNTGKLLYSHNSHDIVLDATTLLSKFSRMQALVNCAKIQPNCTYREYAMVLRWLEDGDETAKALVRAIAEKTAQLAISSAAMQDSYGDKGSLEESGELSAARAIEYSVSPYGAYSSAWSVAYSAAKMDMTAFEVAMDAANDMLLTLVEEAIEENKLK